MLIEFDLDGKVKGAKVKKIQTICANDLKHQLGECWHLNLIIKRNDIGVLSRLIQCAECHKIHEWSVAEEEECVGDHLLDRPSLHKCPCTETVCMCKCCPFYFYGHKRHY